ncbi:MAG: TIGR02710 family CRISPR-associated CARF protein [Pseudomonadota bacterium]
MIIKRSLIVTVGTGTRPDVYIVKPLVKTIRDSRPDFLVLIVTDVSRMFGESIVKELGIDQSGFMMESLKDFDDFQAVFRSINRVFRKLDEMGFSPEEIQLDFTSGTKAMSSGAVLSAIYNQCASIKYITGQRKNGVVIDGTEKFLTVSPSAVFALHDIQLAHELILRLRFATADEILGNLKLDLLDKEESRWAKNLRLISQAYLAWDTFDHKTAQRKMDKVEWGLSTLKPFKPSSEATTLLRNLVAGDNKNEFLFLDLFNNAVRRGKEGKYDDAVARFYRATELFAQQILAEEPYGINTGDVDLSLVPDAMRSILERNKSDMDGKIRIGMEMDYKLLSELGHAVGAHFLEDKQLRGRLGERNGSILAHGLSPVSKSLYKKLLSSVLSLFRLEQPDFADRSREVQFPWLTDGD